MLSNYLEDLTILQVLFGWGYVKIFEKQEVFDLVKFLSNRDMTCNAEWHNRDL